MAQPRAPVGFGVAPRLTPGPKRCHVCRVWPRPATRGYVPVGLLAEPDIERRYQVASGLLTLPPRHRTRPWVDTGEWGHAPHALR